MRITVVGSGGWGTALALLLLENGHEVTLWSYTEEESRVLRETRENPMLRGVRLPESLHLTADLNAAGESDVVVMVTPSYAVRETAAKLRGIVKPGTVIVSASKGIERGSSLRLSQVIDQELGGSCPVVVLSGPSHAEEVGRGVPTVVVSASRDKAAAELVRKYSHISEDGQKLFQPEKETVGLCPRCGKQVYEGKKNFACSDRACQFVMWKNDRFWTSRRKEMTRKMAADLLKKGRTSVKGMWSEKKGSTYDAVVILDDTGGKYVNFKLEFPKRKDGVHGKK